MNILDIRNELEKDLTWRHEEMRLLDNQLSSIVKEEDKNRYRKSLIVMLYAHYEGFCKTALTIYANAINSEGLKCAETTDCITAASLATIFKDFNNISKKSRIFNKDLPDDTQLHSFARQTELISNLHDIWKTNVNIPIEIIDVESNLKPIVMRKILFRLGFPYDAFEKHEGDIHNLLIHRNRIAHGDKKDGIEQKDYEKVEKATYRIMDELILLIMDALTNTIYLKKSTP